MGGRPFNCDFNRTSENWAVDHLIVILIEQVKILDHGKLGRVSIGLDEDMSVKASTRRGRERCWQGMPIKASSRPNLMGRSRQGMLVKASSRPSRERSWQGIPIRASSRPNLMSRSRQGNAG